MTTFQPAPRRSVEETLRRGDARQGEHRLPRGGLGGDAAIAGRRAHQPVDWQVETRGFDDDFLILGEHGIGCDERIERFAQPPARQRQGALDVLAADDHQIEVPVELQMLKAVVEHVHRGAELGFGEDAGAIAVGTGQHDDARQLTGQHHRLVARHIQAGADLPRVADDDDFFRPARAAVAAAENGRLLTHFEEHPGDSSSKRGLAAAADGEIADADDGVAQPLPEVGPRRVPLPPPPRNRRVKAAQHGRGATGTPANERPVTKGEGFTAFRRRGTAARFRSRPTAGAG